MSRIVVATASTVVGHRGQRIVVTAGTAWDAQDPFVRVHPELFSDDPRFLRRTVELDGAGVEQATAAPGEKRRGVRR